MPFPEHTSLVAIAAVISAAVALVSATLGPWVSWKIAKRQIISGIRASSRQQWLDHLRNEVAEYSGIIIEGGLKRVGGTLTTDDLDLLAKTLTQKLTKIELLLNLKEQEHKDLAWHLREAHSETWNPDKEPDIENIREHMDRAVKICQEILKAEWDKTKHGE